MGYLNPHTHDLDGTPHPRSQVVTICGSTRFRAEIAEANRRLTLAGYLVFAPGVFAHDGDEITDAQKAALDRLHFVKIDRADWIYVVNPDGYVGESTRREIEYARRTGRAIESLEPLDSEGEQKEMGVWSGENAVRNAERGGAEQRRREESRARLDDANTAAQGSRVTLAELRRQRKGRA